MKRWQFGWILAGFAASAIAVAATETAPAAPAAVQPSIRHVFVIVLENEGFERTFGAHSAAPYLARELPRHGVLLSQYFGTAHFSLGNYLAMISGQGGTPETRGDCDTYADFVQTGTTPDGQAIGRGCVYPSTVHTLADQLTAKGYSWRAYEEDMGNDTSRESATCGHPRLDAPDATQKAEPPSTRVPSGDQYATRHNPFMYFHSIIDSPDCDRHVVSLSQLVTDLASVTTTPNFSFITPNLCHDGHDAPCVTGERGGLGSADAFLRRWVPRILASPGYRDGGLLLVTFDEGDVDEQKLAGRAIAYRARGATCCRQEPGPNIGSFPQTIRDGADTETFDSFGGERTGAVLISPRVAPGRVSVTPFNHYSLLKTLEDLFGTGAYLGYAGQPGLVGFFDPGSDVVLKVVPTPAAKPRR